MEKQTLKDLFIENNSYIIEIPINDKHLLFVEGLSEYGETINKEFNINNIKTFCIELIEDGDYIEGIDSLGATLEETIDDLREKGMNLLCN